MTTFYDRTGVRIGPPQQVRTQRPDTLLHSGGHAWSAEGRFEDGDERLRCSRCHCHSRMPLALQTCVKPLSICITQRSAKIPRTPYTDEQHARRLAQQRAARAAIRARRLA